MIEFGEKVKSEEAARILKNLESSLAPSEEVWMILRANNIIPPFDHWVITNSRFIAAASTSPSPIKKQIYSDEFEAEQITKSKMNMPILVLTVTGVGDVKFGTCQQVADSARLLQVLEHLRTCGSGAFAREYSTKLLDLRNLAISEILDGSVVISDQQIGGEVTQKVKEEIFSNCREGERPWFVLSGGSDGVLVAFDDRLMLIKVGALTSLLADAFGGGRVTTFMFHDITGIEYNSGILNGVLEILTPSYQGTSNKDFWKGSSAASNSNSDNPQTLSNTLPLIKSTHKVAQPQLNELRRRIADAKNATITVQNQIPTNETTTTSSTDELKKLGELHQAGILTDSEFSEAKDAVIQKLKRGN